MSGILACKGHALQGCMAQWKYSVRFLSTICEDGLVSVLSSAIMLSTQISMLRE